VPSDRPLPNSYWVLPDRLAAGEYPGSLNREQAGTKIRRLLQAGVTFFLDLTEAGNLQPYDSLLTQEEFRPAGGVQYRRMPIKSFSTPSRAEMIRTLDTIDTALAGGQTVYVHCWAGIGRTGTVVGCYLVRHGLSGTQALEEIAQLRQGTPHGGWTSPETEAQRQMVLNWAEEAEVG
jgi:protein-tyrosine phosphatase